ncbi:1,4-dihydroxy-6-naphthoate synthase [Malaciobacter marinus]|uniref:1,4-dihydroxy-6-naphtoate synthase n=1 Tax=Malaciobacter marinus TaxID=505249 RepID=A0A347TP52_9BACT|nr:MqnA/MqnD/SBP family protein [Malaciobacter marinus]AXX88380.1 1,4-dihydroxy-6-naphthoate synthase [Malaciobacter marinus]PHO13414.1 succinate--CoA ligase [Malaciobacter marinus]PHO16646.1 succinate--CoA ligase [Malaciobacter marinus]
MKTITVAHSPDADDIFMYYAIKFGWVGAKDAKFENIAADIETLNQATLKGEYDICAISFALYPFVKDDYALLKTAVSFGQGYGPKLVKRKDKKLKKNFKVALSGEFTTNALLFKIAYPEARITYMNFLDIEKAVIEGTVDAGVLIHESILNYNDELEVEKEMWDIWEDLSGGGLPLPLGGMCLRRSIPLHSAIDYENTLIKAVDVANKNRKVLATMLLEKGLIRVDASTLDKYLDLYANDESVNLSEVQYKALDKLFELGYKHGFYENLIKAKDFLIPSEYEDLRNK